MCLIGRHAARQVLFHLPVEMMLEFVGELGFQAATAETSGQSKANKTQRTHVRPPPAPGRLRRRAASAGRARNTAFRGPPESASRTSRAANFPKRPIRTRSRPDSPACEARD